MNKSELNEITTKLKTFVDLNHLDLGILAKFSKCDTKGPLIGESGFKTLNALMGGFEFYIKTILPRFAKLVEHFEMLKADISELLTECGYEELNPTPVNLSWAIHIEAKYREVIFENINKLKTKYPWNFNTIYSLEPQGVKAEDVRTLEMIQPNKYWSLEIDKIGYNQNGFSLKYLKERAKNFLFRYPDLVDINSYIEIDKSFELYPFLTLHKDYFVIKPKVSHADDQPIEMANGPIIALNCLFWMENMERSFKQRAEGLAHTSTETLKGNLTLSVFREDQGVKFLLSKHSKEIGQFGVYPDLDEEEVFFGFMERTNFIQLYSKAENQSFDDISHFKNLDVVGFIKEIIKPDFNFIDQTLSSIDVKKPYVNYQQMGMVMVGCSGFIFDFTILDNGEFKSKIKMSIIKSDNSQSYFRSINP